MALRAGASPPSCDVTLSQGEAAAIALSGLRRQLEVANAKLRLLTAADGERMVSRRQSTEDTPPRGLPPGPSATPGHGIVADQVCDAPLDGHACCTCEGVRDQTCAGQRIIRRLDAGAVRLNGLFFLWDV